MLAEERGPDRSLRHGRAWQSRALLVLFLTLGVASVGQAQEGWVEAFRLSPGDGSILTRVMDIRRDRFGRILVLEPSLGSVLVLDRSGDVALVLGRRGSGPGEFLGPVELGVRADTILVSDVRQQRYSAFLDDGTHVFTRRVPTPGGQLVSRLRPTADGGWVGATTPRIVDPTDRANHMIQILRASPGASRVDTLWQYDSGATTWRAPSGLPWGVAWSAFGASGGWHVMEGGAVAFVDGVTGRVTVRDLVTGDTRWSADLGVEGAAVTERDRAVILDSLRVARRRRGDETPRGIELSTPVAWSVADRVLDSGRDTLWVRSPLLSRDLPSDIWLRVTPNDVTSFAMPTGFGMYAIWGDTLVGVVRDEFDVPVIKGFTQAARRDADIGRRE